VKINWFSPLRPARLASARLPAELLPHLRSRAEIVVWVEERQHALTNGKSSEIRLFDLQKPLPWREINRADLSVFHLGDDSESYAAIWSLSRQQPGIIVLHDLTLQRLFAGAVAQKRMTQREYLSMAEFHHPGVGRRAVASYLSGRSSLEELAAQCSLIGAATENALAVIVHSPAAFELLSGNASVPIALIPLEETESSREAYADALLEMAKKVPDFERIWSTRVMSRRVGGALDGLCTEKEVPHLLPRIAHEIEILNHGNERLAAATAR
jgi:hypothetical protein